MTPSPEPPSLGKFERIILVVVGLLLATLLFFLKGGLNSKAPLDQLARKSLAPEVALLNGKPTVIEFYADWCEACRSMAPAMFAIEHEMSSQVDIVLLNVDNPLWEDLIENYSVKGIPQLNFFDSDGKPDGTSSGLRTQDELHELIASLAKDDPIPTQKELGQISQINSIIK